MIIQGAMTDLTGEELVTEETIRKFNQMAGKKISMAYFSNHWFNGIKFPRTMATAARNQGTMPWIGTECALGLAGGDRASTIFPPMRDGTFDNELRQWGVDAHAFGSKLVVEFGVEQTETGFHGHETYPQTSSRALTVI